MSEKPRLKYSRGHWYCKARHDGRMLWGRGLTPESAYRCWDEQREIKKPEHDILVCVANTELERHRRASWSKQAD